jgi:hypothetical protein
METDKSNAECDTLRVSKKTEQNKENRKKHLEYIINMREPCIIAAPYQGALNMSFCVFFCFLKASEADINASSHHG